MSSSRSISSGDPFASGRLSLASVGAPPAPINQVFRPRLFEALDRRLPISLIIAAGGFGKTSMISGWLAASSSAGNVAWLALDHVSDDAHLFLAQLIAAIRVSAPNACEAGLTLLSGLPASSPGNILRSILNELEQSRLPWTIVLDDYPADAPQIDAIVGSAGEHVSSNVSLIIASRGLPQLPLARWRVKQRLTEIGMDELRFTPQETRDFMRDAIATLFMTLHPKTTVSIKIKYQR